jgi:methyl-accepting chemotaxis protein
MGEVVASVQRVTDIMAEISTAGDEQSAGIEQINQAVSEMDTVTQQNGAGGGRLRRPRPCRRRRPTWSVWSASSASMVSALPRPAAPAARAAQPAKLAKLAAAGQPASRLARECAGGGQYQAAPGCGR